MRWPAIAIGLLALPVAALAGGPSPPSPAPLDLDAVVALALARNPGLAAVEERRVEVAGGVREARADALPQVALSGGWNRSRDPSLLNSPDFEEFIDMFPGGDFEPAEQTLYDLSLELSQPIYTFGKVGAAVELAKIAVDVTEARIETARLDTALAAAEAYFGMLEARERLEEVEAQRRARRESLAVVEARFELGDATRLELLQAEAALAEVVPLADQARGALAVAAARLRSLLDLQDAGELELAPTSAEPPPAPTVEEALALAFEERPELTDLEAQIAALERQRTVTAADGKPQVELTGAYGRTVRLPENLDDPLFDDWRVRIGLRWELADGGRRRGQIAQIESRREQTRHQLEELRNRVVLEIEQAVSELRTAVARQGAAEASAAAAAEAARVARESYEAGVALQADWIAAQEREIQAEVLRVQAYYDARVRQVRLERALGRLPGGGTAAAARPARESAEEGAEETGR